MYLHELVSGSRLVLPSLLPPPRVSPCNYHSDDRVCVCVLYIQNPELVKRLERIKREQEQKQYDEMVSDIDNSVRNVPQLQCVVVYRCVIFFSCRNSSYKKSDLDWKVYIIAPFTII